MICSIWIRSRELNHHLTIHPHAGVSGDVHFDDDEKWILKNSHDGGTDFLWTAIHEIGHAIGLDHSDYKDAIMYPFYQGYKDNLELDADDIVGIQSIYGKGKTAGVLYGEGKTAEVLYGEGKTPGVLYDERKPPGVLYGEGKTAGVLYGEGKTPGVLYSKGARSVW